MAEYSLINEKVSTDQKGNVISSQGLAPVPTIQTVTPAPDNTNYAGITGGVTESIINDYKTLNEKVISSRNAQTSAGSDILTLMRQLSGKEADTQTANEVAGVNKETENLNKYVQQLADLNSQASSLNREAQAIPIQVQQNAQGQGQTDRGVAPLEAGALRLNALKALSIGQQSDIAVAAATGSQLRLQAAKDKAQQIIDLKYKPLENEIALKQKQYDLNKDALDFFDKKLSIATQTAINKEAKDLEYRKEQEKQVQNLMVEAARSGADQLTLNNIKNSGSVDEAIAIAGHSLGAEFRQKIAQQEFENKIQLQQVAISRANLGLARDRLNFEKTKEAFDQALKLAGEGGKVTFDESGNPVPVPAATSVMSQALSKANIDLVGGLLKDKALDTAVGPNPLSRGTNFFSSLVSVDNKTGATSNFIGGVEQLRQQLTLDALQNAKAKGATFGALSEGELALLASSATKLSQWAIVKDGKTIGYNASESDFRKELDKINNFAKLDYVLKGGNPNDVGIKPLPNGKYGTLNSDGSITELE